MTQYDYSQPYVTRDEYLEVKGVDLSIELQDDDNQSNKVNRFIQDITNFVLDHLVMEYNCNELNRQTNQFEDLAEFRRIRFHYGMLEQIEYVLNNGLIQLDSGINRETGAIMDLSGLVIGSSALKQFRLGGFCNKQEGTGHHGDLSPKDMPTVEELVLELGKKVDKVDGKGLSTNDYTTADKLLLKSVAQDLNSKVDQENGKVLSDNNFSDAYKAKVDGIESGAQQNVIEEIKIENQPISVAGKSVNIDVSHKEDKANKSTSISSASNDIQYASARAVHNAVESAKASAEDYADSKVTRANLVQVLGEASQYLNGLMSAQDKERLDVLYALLGDSEDADTVVDTINEVLAIFNQYPEGADLVNALASKVKYDDIINTVDSNETRKPLSAAMGKYLKDLIDALTLVVNAKANSNDVYTKTEIDEMVDGFVFADVDDELNEDSENPVKNKTIAKLTPTKETKIESSTYYNPTSYSSTFNGWLLAFSKSLASSKITKIRTKLSMDHDTMSVKVLIMDTNKNVIQEKIIDNVPNNTEVDLVVNFDITQVPTDNYYIGIVSNYAESGSHLYIYGYANPFENQDYVDVAMPIETAYTTNKGASWAWMGNTNSMSNKRFWFVVFSENYTKSASAIDTFTKEETNQEFLSKENQGYVVYPTVNLFNIKTRTPAGEWASYVNGRIEHYPDENQYVQNYCRSDYIEIEENTKYTFSGGNANVSYATNQGFCFYDENKNFISGIAPRSAQGPQTITSPANAKYCIISFGSITESNYDVQFEQGETATAYQEYKGDLFYFENLRVKQSQIENTSNKTLIRCADSYDLVVGDTFELFYKGILNVFNYKNYNVLCQCDIGKCLSRKFMVDSITNTMVGTHNLYIYLYDNESNLLESKIIVLNVVTTTTSPQSEKVILCMGDSLTQGGQWADELGRRLTKSTNQTSWGATAPTGLNLSNIKLIGKKTSIGGFGFEGYGGWTFADYLSTSSPTMYWLTAENNGKTSSDQESIWQDANGVQWQLETIETNRLKFKKYNGSGVMPSSGTLTWVSGGVDTANITFTASSIAEGNPFVYNGQIDFESYCADFDVSTIDYVFILLGWNGATISEPNMNNCKTFIGLLRTFNPSIKVVLIGLQIPSLDGCGINYGATSIYSQYMKLVDYVFNLDDAYKSVAEFFESGVYAINLSGQFDTEYNMPVTTMTANSRSTVNVEVQNNGVHPQSSGYYQIADVAYRWFNKHN